MGSTTVTKKRKRDRVTALYLLERGQITEAEAAQLVGVTRQRIHALSQGFAAREQRERYLQYLWRNTRKSRWVRKQCAAIES